MTAVDIGRMNKFSMPFYFQAVFGILGRPRNFFSELPPAMGLLPPLVFLAISALCSCAASLTNTRLQAFYITGGIYLFNAVGMVFIMAGLGYLVMALTIGRKVPFARLLSIYALCSGVVLLFAWVPYLNVFTEPWKWYLVGAGLTKGCNMKPKEALLTILLSLAIWIFFFWALMLLLRH